MQENNMIHSPLRAIQEEIEQAEKEIHHLEQQLKAKNNVVSKLTRRERTNRLCTRAGMLESFLVEPEALTNEQVMELLKTAFRQSEVKQKLKEMLDDAKENM